MMGGAAAATKQFPGYNMAIAIIYRLEHTQRHVEKKETSRSGKGNGGPGMITIQCIYMRNCWKRAPTNPSPNQNQTSNHLHPFRKKYWIVLSFSLLLCLCYTCCIAFPHRYFLTPHLIHLPSLLSTLTPFFHCLPINIFTFKILKLTMQSRATLVSFSSPYIGMFCFRKKIVC